MYKYINNPLKALGFLEHVYIRKKAVQKFEKNRKRKNTTCLV